MLERNNMLGGILEKIPLKGLNHDFLLSQLLRGGVPLKKTILELVSGYSPTKYYCYVGIHRRGM
jgi:hypothetical protein